MPVRSLEFSHQVAGLKVEGKSLVDRLRRMDQSPYSIPPGDLSLAFVDDHTLCGLHQAFLNDPTPTDVMTFPGNTASGHAGEIVISVERARAIAPLHGQTFNEEVYLYIVHGWLHLAGWNDSLPAEQGQMRMEEQELLRFIQPLPETFAWTPGSLSK